MHNVVAGVRGLNVNVNVTSLDFCTYLISRNTIAFLWCYLFVVQVCTLLVTVAPSPNRSTTAAILVQCPWISHLLGFNTHPLHHIGVVFKWPWSIIWHCIALHFIILHDSGVPHCIARSAVADQWSPNQISFMADNIYQTPPLVMFACLQSTLNGVEECNVQDKCNLFSLSVI